jgi:hypothetical protein
MRKSFALFFVIALAMTFVGLAAISAVATHTECHDDLDNDGDGLIDFDGGPAGEAPDPDCTSADDFHESGTGATPTPTGGVTPSCRASAVRVENLLGITIEPFVANDQRVPCTDEDASLIPPTTTIGPVAASALTAETQTFPGGGVAGASAANVGLAPPGLGATAALAFASADCSGATPVFTGESIVVGVFGVPGGPILIPPGHMDIPIPLVGTLHLNEEIVEPDRITVRAIWLESTNPLVDSVVVGEAIADCEIAPGPTPTHTPSPTPTHTGPAS